MYLIILLKKSLNLFLHPTANTIIKNIIHLVQSLKILNFALNSRDIHVERQ